MSRAYGGFIKRLRAEARRKRLRKELSGRFKPWHKMSKSERDEAISELKLEGLSYWETAEVLGTTKNIIISWYARERRKSKT